MRAFGTPISASRDAELRLSLGQIFDLLPDVREIRGDAYAMDPADQIVIYERSIKLPDGQRYRLARTMPEVRPPFEWIYEISSDIDEIDYFKHYLVRDNDIVFAQRKELTPIDETEANIIEADLATLRRAIADLT